MKEFIHLNDYEELAREIINAEIRNNTSKEGGECDIVLRMKSVISPRGRNLNLKSALYKVYIFKHLLF